MSTQNKIVITGGEGRFAKTLKLYNKTLNIYYPNRKLLNILNVKSIENYLKRVKPKYLLHCAALSRPMDIHDKYISKSIDLNIIGTSNITKACAKKNIKLIYFSTSYVYPGKKGNYLETHSVLPGNSYAWSKLGGEAAVHLYKNSLILRVCMTEKPFVHKVAFVNVKNNFIYQEEVANILFKLLNQKGIINIGGKIQSVYDFAIKDNKSVKKAFLKKNMNIGVPFDSSMNTLKLKKILTKIDKKF